MKAVFSLVVYTLGESTLIWGKVKVWSFVKRLAHLQGVEAVLVYITSHYHSSICALIHLSTTTDRYGLHERSKPCAAANTSGVRIRHGGLRWPPTKERAGASRGGANGRSRTY